MFRNILLLAACLTTLSCKGDDVLPNAGGEVCNVENDVVRYVLASSDAQFGATASCIPQSIFDNSASYAYRADQPSGKTISFSCSDAPTAYVSLTDAALGTRLLSDTVQINDGRGTYSFTNLTPNQTYRYQVSTPDGRIISDGTFSAAGRLRMIAIDGGFNIRDLGGWVGLAGRPVRYGQIYRGGSLGGTDMDGTHSDISAAGKAELARLGIRAQLDLRAATNGGKYTGEGSLHSYSAAQAPLPTMDFNNTMTDYGAYNQDQSVVSDVAWIIYELRRGRPVYFNCRQGADRTGTVAFIIEGLLGCDRTANDAGGNQMAIDYELTGFSQANRIDNWKVSTSARPAAEAYANTNKLFRHLLDLQPAEPTITLTTLQEKCYYYLNRYTNPAWKAPVAHIDSADLDWFIQFMLGNMPNETYAPFRPTWAAQGEELKTVAERCSNAVRYAEE